jgi:hypothetical protein
MSYSEEEQKEMTQPFRFLSARNNKRQLGKNSINLDVYTEK